MHLNTLTLMAVFLFLFRGTLFAESTGFAKKGAAASTNFGNSISNGNGLAAAPSTSSPGAQPGGDSNRHESRHELAKKQRQERWDMEDHVEAERRQLQDSLKKEHRDAEMRFDEERHRGGNGDQIRHQQVELEKDIRRKREDFEDKTRKEERSLRDRQDDERRALERRS